MAWKIKMLAIILLLLPACAGYTPPRFDPALYPTYYRAYDLAFYWNVEKTADTLTVNGFVKNIIHAYIRDMELSATLFDEMGKKLGKDQVFYFLSTVSMDEYAPFALTFPLQTGADPKKIRFFYRYHIPDNDSITIPYFQSFEADI